MDPSELAELLSELVEAAAAGKLADDDAHVIGHSLVFRYPGHDLTVRAARRRVVAVVDGEPLELDRAYTRRILAAFPAAAAETSERRARVAERLVHVRVAPSAADETAGVPGLDPALDAAFDRTASDD